MIGFVTCMATFLYQNYYKGGKVAIKANHTYENMLSTIVVIQDFNKVTSWPQLLSKFLVTPMYVPVCNAASDWPRTFYALGVFV